MELNQNQLRSYDPQHYFEPAHEIYDVLPTYGSIIPTTHGEAGQEK